MALMVHTIRPATEEGGGGGRRREEEEGGAAEPLPRKHVIVRLSHCLGYGAACYGAACYYCCLLRCGCAGPKDIHQHHSGRVRGSIFRWFFGPRTPPGLALVYIRVPQAEPRSTRERSA